MKKVLIANAVPTNNGDAALVFGLREKLMKKGYEVIISTIHYDTVRKLYPEIMWIKAEYQVNRLQYRFYKLFPRIKKKIMKFKISNNKIYRDIDIVISAPGGYINSYYGIEERMYCMDLIKKLYKTKLIMYSQSVGPLNYKDKYILEQYMDIFDLFMVRDEISYNNVKSYKNVIKTNDAAFLLNIIKSKNEDNIIGISVREWKFDGRNKEKYISLIKNIVMKCIDNGNKVEFISTCQGINDYIDDSKIANEIMNTLEARYKSQVKVNNKYYSLEELRGYIQKFKFIVGTRLHMCILGMMSGIPTFNISYEVKGKECYKMLKLSKYSIDYNNDISESMEKFQDFIENNEKLKRVYLQKAIEMNEEANKYFEYMISNIIKMKG